MAFTIVAISGKVKQIDDLEYISLSPYIIKSVLKQAKDIDVIVFDFIIGDSKEDLINQIRSYQPDILAISTYLWSISELTEISANVKSSCPECTIIAGGPEAQNRIKYYLETSPIEYISVGDIEPSIKEFIKWKKGEKAKLEFGWAYLSGCCVVKLPASYASDDELKVSPFLDGSIELQNDKRYYVDLEVGRGCPFSCAYCTWGSEKLHTFPLTRTIKELQFLLQTDCVKAIYIIHSNPLLNRDFASELFDCIQNRNSRNIPIYFTCNPQYLNSETIEQLKKSSINTLGFGLQSVCDKTNREINRKFDIYSYSNKIEKLKENREISISFDVIVGLPEDTAETIEETINFALKYSPHAVGVFPLLVLPGSQLFSKSEKGERSIRFRTDPPYSVIDTNWLSVKEINRLSRECLGMELILGIPFARYLLYTLNAEKRFSLIRTFINKIVLENSILKAIWNRKIPFGITSNQNEVDRKKEIMITIHKSPNILLILSLFLDYVSKLSTDPHDNNHQILLYWGKLERLIQKVDLYFPFFSDYCSIGITEENTKTICSDIDPFEYKPVLSLNEGNCDLQIVTSSQFGRVLVKKEQSI